MRCHTCSSTPIKVSVKLAASTEIAVQTTSKSDHTLLNSYFHRAISSHLKKKKVSVHSPNRANTLQGAGLCYMPHGRPSHESCESCKSSKI